MNFIFLPLQGEKQYRLKNKCVQFWLCAQHIHTNTNLYSLTFIHTCVRVGVFKLEVN